VPNLNRQRSQDHAAQRIHGYLRSKVTDMFAVESETASDRRYLCVVGSPKAALETRDGESSLRRIIVAAMTTTESEELF